MTAVQRSVVPGICDGSFGSEGVRIWDQTRSTENSHTAAWYRTAKESSGGMRSMLVHSGTPFLLLGVRWHGGEDMGSAMSLLNATYE